MSISSLPLTTAVQGCSSAEMAKQPLSAEEAVRVASMLKALADPVRLRLLSSIASRVGQEACVCEVSDGFDISQPTISHHLKVLREAGLLISERRASWVYYKVVPEALQRLSKVLLTESGAGVSA